MFKPWYTQWNAKVSLFAAEFCGMVNYFITLNLLNLFMDLLGFERGPLITLGCSRSRVKGTPLRLKSQNKAT
jgi:hypothetical protein